MPFLLTRLRQKRGEKLIHLLFFLPFFFSYPPLRCINWNEWRVSTDKVDWKFAMGHASAIQAVSVICFTWLWDQSVRWRIFSHSLPLPPPPSPFHTFISFFALLHPHSHTYHRSEGNFKLHFFLHSLSTPLRTVIYTRYVWRAPLGVRSFTLQLFTLENICLPLNSILNTRTSLDFFPLTRTSENIRTGDERAKKWNQVKQVNKILITWFI